MLLITAAFHHVERAVRGLQRRGPLEPERSARIDVLLDDVTRRGAFLWNTSKQSGLVPCGRAFDGTVVREDTWLRPGESLHLADPAGIAGPVVQLTSQQRVLATTDRGRWRTLRFTELAPEQLPRGVLSGITYMGMPCTTEILTGLRWHAQRQGSVTVVSAASDSGGASRHLQALVHRSGCVLALSFVGEDTPPPDDPTPSGPSWFQLPG